MKKEKKGRTTDRVTNDTVRTAYAILEKYKAGKASLEKRIIDNEQWWTMRHYDEKNGKKAMDRQPGCLQISCR